jgi:hypothetical protein
MRRACSTHERDEKCIQNFTSYNLKAKDHLEEVDVDWSFVLKFFLNIGGGGGGGGGDWTNLAQNRDLFRGLMSTIKKEPSGFMQGRELFHGVS